MNLHIASWLITMILVIVQFYNDHITFYRSCKYRLVLRCCTRSMVAIVLSKHSHQASCFVVSTDGWMLWTYVVVAFKRYVWRWPIRPMTLLTVPSMAVSICKYEPNGSCMIACCCGIDSRLTHQRFVQFWASMHSRPSPGSPNRKRTRRTGPASNQLLLRLENLVSCRCIYYAESLTRVDIHYVPQANTMLQRKYVLKLRGDSSPYCWARTSRTSPIF